MFWHHLLFHTFTLYSNSDFKYRRVCVIDVKPLSLSDITSLWLYRILGPDEFGYYLSTLDTEEKTKQKQETVSTKLYKASLSEQFNLKKALH